MTKQTYTVTVDYSKSVTELVKEGKYDWANDDITADHFPSKEKGTKRIKIALFKFDHDISGEDVIRKMGKGFRPASLKEILSLGAQYPDLQRKDWIVALGSTWRGSYGYVYVPCLNGGGGGRGLRLNWWASVWRSSWRFAAVQVSSTLKPSITSKTLGTSDTLTLGDVNKKLDKIIKFFSIK